MLDKWQRPDRIGVPGSFWRKRKINNLSQKILSSPQGKRLHKAASRVSPKIERVFILIKNIIRKLLPLVPRYAVHLVIFMIALLVVFNNLAGKQDQKSGEEKEGSCILFAGVLQNNPGLIEGRSDVEDLTRGIGGFSSQIFGTVLAGTDSLSESEGAAGNHSTLATVQGTALIPLSILEQEIEAGPIEEGRSEAIEHTVKAGESVSTIAANYGVSVATILSANNLSETSYIKPGDQLEIPPVSGVLYTVKRGDTLGVIAKTYQGDLTEIMEYNHLGDEGDIKMGQVLMIPGGKIPPPTLTTRPSRTPSESIVQAPSSARPGKSGWIWPTSSHKVNQYYSYRHHGVDIDGNTGSAVYAARGGKIIFAGWRSGYGKTIIISHPNGSQTLYAHLVGYKRTGGQVGGGELIGYVGTTGWSTGPHLHFEIRTNRGAVNPLNYMR